MEAFINKVYAEFVMGTSIYVYETEKEYLKHYNRLDKEVMFSNDCVSEESINLSSQMSPGEIHLLENLRFHSGETKNDAGFSWFLSRHGEIYVNDAFSVSHRNHASIVAITSFLPAVAGINLLSEIKNLNNIYVHDSYIFD